MARTQLGAAPTANSKATATTAYVDAKVAGISGGGSSSLANGGRFTTNNAILAVNTFYWVDYSSSEDPADAYLPTAPTNGSVVAIWRTDAVVFSGLVVNTGTGDVLDDSSTSYTLTAGPGGVQFLYVAGTWYRTPLLGNAPLRATPENLSSSVVTRDAAGNARIQTPVQDDDISTKLYVDTGVQTAKNYATQLVGNMEPYAYDYTTSDLTFPSNTHGVVSQFEAFDCTSNSVTITVPHGNTTPGTILRFVRIDTVPANTATIVFGAPDTVQVDNGTTTYSSMRLAPLEYVELIWDGGTWHPSASRIGNVNGNLGTGAFDPAATPGAAMVRDTAGRAQVVDPAVAADIATKNYVDSHSSSVASGGNLTGAATLAANTFYTVDGTGGVFTLTLPTGMSTGAQVVLWRTDSTTTNIVVQPGAGATLADTSPFVLYRGAGGVRFWYIGTTWYAEPMIGGVSGLSPRVNTSNVSGAMVIRDGNARARFADPAAAQDAATKNYVDTQNTAVSTTATGVAAAMALVFGG